MDKKRAKTVLDELRKRKGKDSASPPVQRLLDKTFPQQLKFIQDPARFKAALCTRRAGKSMGCGIALLASALSRPDGVSVYLAPVRGDAKQIMWDPVFKRLDSECGLNAQFNESELSIRLSNDSRIYLVGADAHESLHKRLLGRRYDLAVIDEAGSWDTDLKDLCYSVLKPATADRKGSIVMIGTPENVPNFFHTVTSGEQPGWSLHRWSGEDNPHVPFREEMDDLIRLNPGIEETARFKQQWLGQWVIDETGLCYPHFSQKNVVDIDVEDDYGFVYVLGLDLGFRDATAVVVGRWRLTGTKTFEVVYAEKREGLNVTEVGEWLADVSSTFPISYWTVDIASRQVVEELRDRFGYPLEAAEKSGKSDAMGILDSDLQMGTVVLDKNATVQLQDELRGLCWSKKSLPKLIEDGRCPNHAADALLYAHRLSKHFQASATPVRHDVNSEEWEEERLERILDNQRDLERLRTEDDSWLT